MSTPGLKTEPSGFYLAGKPLAWSSFVFITIIGVFFTIFPGLLRELLSAAYIPHLYCYLGSIPLVWTHVVADSLIGIAYFAISLTLAYLVHRGKSDVPFRAMFVAFGIFIVACGSSHIAEAVTVWVPMYRGRSAQHQRCLHTGRLRPARPIQLLSKPKPVGRPLADPAGVGCTGSNTDECGPAYDVVLREGRPQYQARRHIPTDVSERE